MWLTAAVCSAVFAALTSILAKCGIKKTAPVLATAMRTAVVLLFAFLMALIAGSLRDITRIDGKAWLFLILSGAATGASWLCYFKALSLGDVNKVVPVDKSSTVLSVLLAIIIFGETENLAVKLIGTALIGVGIYMMIERKAEGGVTKSGGWLIYAVLSAVFAALTSVLAKIGVAGVESNLATAIRTAAVLIMAWGIVFAKGEYKGIVGIDKKELVFIAFSGLATGASWLCYYYAVQNGVLSAVIPIDKMSVVLTVLFSRFFLKENLPKKAAVGLCLMCAGTLLLAVM